MSSGSVSVSDCCPDVLCICENWLQVYCDYVTVTLDSCGVETIFEKARTKSVGLKVTNTQSGVHPMDRVFHLSMLENDVQVNVGGTITDADGVSWVIYGVTEVTSFCLKEVFARSVATCYGLLSDVFIFQEDTDGCEDECGPNKKYIRVKKGRGSLYASSATRTSQNDADDLRYRYSLDMDFWPLRELPSGKHRLKIDDGVYRILRVENRGMLVPFFMELEKDSVSCC